jgi:hypothetical protein
MKAVRFAATMKAAALNIIRAAAYRKRRNKGRTPSFHSFGRIIDLIRVAKEHFFNFSDKMEIAEAALPSF